MKCRFKILAHELMQMNTVKGGTRTERLASAHLIMALFHVEFAQLLERPAFRDAELAVQELPGEVVLHCQGRQIRISRVAGQTGLHASLRGFQTMPQGWRAPHVEAAASSTAVLHIWVKQTTETLTGLLAIDLEF